MMWQVLQWAQWLEVLAGQDRLSIVEPESTTSTLIWGMSLSSSSAVKMPAGPAPITMTS